MVDYNFNFVGIKRIEIPKTDSDFVDNATTLSILEKYMPTILSQHKQNASKIEYLWAFYNGVQDIRDKQRPYAKDALNNNRLSENHARRQVDFKVSLFKDRTFTLKKSVKGNEQTKEEIDTLLNYLSDTKVDSKSEELCTQVFALGVGCVEVTPKTDIIYQVGDRYYVDEDFDFDTEAPFNFNVVDPRDNFVVYSSGKNHDALFSVSIINVEKDTNTKNINLQKQILVETRYAYYMFNTEMSFKGLKNMSWVGDKAYYYLPMRECAINIDRIGVIEINRDIFNMVNTLSSSIVDIVEDNSNAILVFKNTDISSDQVTDMRSAGAIVLPTAQSSRAGAEADLDVLKVEMPIKELNLYIENLISKADDIVGVASASNTVTSGGSTGQAIVYGGGWQNAYDIAERQKSHFVDFDKECLTLMLFVCKMFTASPIQNLKQAQVKIKYTITRNDNMQVKAQAIVNMATANVPFKRIVQAVDIWDDEDEVAIEWEERDRQVKNLLNKQSNNTQVE